MTPSCRFYLLPLTLIVLAGCATQGKPPPAISLGEPVQAELLPEPPSPVEVIAVPEPLALPAQLKLLPGTEGGKPTPEPNDEMVRVSRANAEARVAPSREGYVNAIQVWPYSDGALYQLYTGVGRVTVIALLMMGRRCISSFRQASLRASCLRSL
jgi:type IV secretion system protein VirB9